MSAKMDGLSAALEYAVGDIDKVCAAEVKDGGDGLKADLRAQTADALGPRVANTWRSKFFPNQGQSAGPAAFIWSRAPRIIDFFSSDRIITPIGQAFAVPTANVPRAARGRRMSPIEVEARFNAELQPIKLKSGNIGLFIDMFSSRGSRSKGRSAANRKVLMFVLIRQVRGKPLIDISDAANRWASRIAGQIEGSLEAGL